MFWSILYAWGLFGGFVWTTAWLWPSSAWAAGNRVIFDNYSLDTSNIRIQVSNYDDIWDIEFETFDAPFADWWWILGHFYRKKDIKFNLTITWDTAEDLNNRIDEFKKRIKKVGWLLEILVNGEYRVVEASVTKLTFWRQFFHITFVNKVEIVFTTVVPHFRAKTNISASFPGITGVLNEDIDNIWTIGTDLRSYIIFWPGNTWISEVNISVWWFTTQIPYAFVDWDILLVDSITKEVVLLNTWAPLDYNWKLPYLETWSNPIQYEIVWTTVNATITYIYEKRYL